jgi:hypothetical protein
MHQFIGLFCVFRELAAAYGCFDRRMGLIRKKMIRGQTVFVLFTNVLSAHVTGTFAPLQAFWHPG